MSESIHPLIPCLESEKAAEEAEKAAVEIEQKIDEVQAEVEEVREELQKTSEELDDHIDKVMEMEDGAEEVPNRVAAVKVKEEIEEAKKIEEKLYEKEDQLYESKFCPISDAHGVNVNLALDEKEEHVLELEEKKQEKLAEAKMHRESSKGTPPPESQFKKLAPNENKYTMLDHDEL